MFPNDGSVIVVAVVEHALGDTLRSVLLAVGQDANHSFTRDQRSVKGLPRSPRKRHDVHILVRLQSRMGEELQGVEVRV